MRILKFGSNVGAILLLICTSVHNLTGGCQTNLLSSSSVYLLPNPELERKPLQK